MSAFAEAINAARRSASPPAGPTTPADDRPGEAKAVTPRETHGDGPEVQLSVRLPAGLRTAVAEAATGQGLTVTAFVQRALRRAVAETSDSFVGLADELARTVRTELRAAVDAGAYREAADEVERTEAWS